MKPALFEKIRTFYSEFDSHLLQVQGNVCKACGCDECCTFAARGGKHPVSPMELEYIRDYYRESGYPRANVEMFQEYLSRTRDEKGEVVHPICPFFDYGEHACSIYPARPLSCRMYGSFFLEHFPVPSRCYFRNLSKTIRRDSLFEDVPLALEFSELKLEHAGMRRVKGSIQGGSPQAGPDTEEAGLLDETRDPYVRACRLEAEGKLPEALAAYQESSSKYPNQAFILSCVGSVCLRLGRHDEAAEYLRRAASLRPENALYHFMLAAAFELSGNPDEAAGEYEKTISLNPENAVAHASLAALYMARGETEKSLVHYAKAKEIDPDYPFPLIAGG